MPSSTELHSHSTMLTKIVFINHLLHDIHGVSIQIHVFSTDMTLNIMSANIKDKNHSTSQHCVVYVLQCLYNLNHIKSRKRLMIHWVTWWLPVCSICGNTFLKAYSFIGLSCFTFAWFLSFKYFLFIFLSLQINALFVFYADWFDRVFKKQDR